MADKRIIEYPTALEVENTDFVLMDNNSDGTRKFPAKQLGVTTAFSGATASSAGTMGLVPTPNAGDQNKILQGDGTWSDALPNALANEVTARQNADTQMQDDIEDIQNQLLADAVYGEAQGSLITLTDASAAPAEELKVAIGPVQDLHGYEYPWVGGAGKNKLEVIATTQTVGGVTFTVNDDGTVTVNGTASGWQAVYRNYGNVQLKANTEYILTSEGRSTELLYVDLCNGTTKITSTDYSASRTFSVEEDMTATLNVVVFINETVSNQTIKPMIRLATETDSAFAPYSNICPISGWDEVNVVVSPTTEAGDGTTYTIQLGSTYYGGELDVKRGVLRVDRAGKIYDGTEEWNVESTYNFYASSGRGRSSQPYYGIDKLLCSHTQSRTSSTSNPNNCYIATSGNLNIQFDSSTVEHTADAFKAWLVQQYNNGTPLTISYELITPLEIQLTATEVTLLKGINNLGANSGDTYVKYRRDLNIFLNDLERRIKALEEGQ